MKKLLNWFEKQSLKKQLLIIGALLVVGFFANGMTTDDASVSVPSEPAKVESAESAKPAAKKNTDPVVEAIKNAPLAAAEFAEIRVNDHAGTPEDGDKIAVVLFEQTGVQNCNSIRLNIANVVNEAFRGAEELSEITVKGRVDGASIVWLSITRDEYEKESDGYLSKKDIVGLPGYGESLACK